MPCVPEETTDEIRESLDATMKVCIQTVLRLPSVYEKKKHLCRLLCCVQAENAKLSAALAEFAKEKQDLVNLEKQELRCVCVLISLYITAAVSPFVLGLSLWCEGHCSPVGQSCVTLLRFSKWSEILRTLCQSKAERLVCHIRYVAIVPFQALCRCLFYLCISSFLAFVANLEPASGSSAPLLQ